MVSEVSKAGDVYHWPFFLFTCPEKIAYKKRQANRTVGLKLNATQVKAIKDSISNPKRKLTYKQMAQKYDVSEMTLYRIKSGENWSRIK